MMSEKSFVCERTKKQLYQIDVELRELVGKVNLGRFLGRPRRRWMFTRYCATSRDSGDHFELEWDLEGNKNFGPYEAVDFAVLEGLLEISTEVE